MSKTRFIPGDYKAVCDVCGFVYMASELARRWDNLMVCQKDWEPRHPQDLLRVRPERSTPPWTRPEQPDRFIDTTVPFDGSDL